MYPCYAFICSYVSSPPLHMFFETSFLPLNKWYIKIDTFTHLLEFSLKSSCLHPLFGPLFTPYPLFEWDPQCMEVLLNLGMKSWKSAFNAQGWLQMVAMFTFFGELVQSFTPWLGRPPTPTWVYYNLHVQLAFNMRFRV